MRSGGFWWGEEVFGMCEEDAGYVAVGMDADVRSYELEGGTAKVAFYRF